MFRFALLFVPVLLILQAWTPPTPAGENQSPPPREALSNDELRHLRNIVFAVPFETRAQFEAAYLIWKDAYWRGMLSSQSGALERTIQEPYQAVQALWPEIQPLLLLRSLGKAGQTAIQLYRKLLGEEFITEGSPDPALAVRYARDWLSTQPRPTGYSRDIPGLPGVFRTPFDECILSSEDLEQLQEKIQATPQEIRTQVDTIFKAWDHPILGMTPAQQSKTPMTQLEAIGPAIIPLLLEKAANPKRPYYTDAYLYTLLIRLNTPTLTQAAITALEQSQTTPPIIPHLTKLWLRRSQALGGDDEDKVKMGRSF